MTMKKTLATVLAAGAMSTGLAMAQPLEHHTVLTGTVASVVPLGAQVQEGDTLVTVETLAGPMAASKAVVSGQVTAVEVHAGESVQRGQAVVVVESK